MHRAVIERIIGRTKHRLEGFIRHFISFRIEIHIVITIDMIPWEAHPGNSMQVWIEQTEIITHQVTQTDSKFVICGADQLRYNSFLEKIDLFQGVYLGVTKNHNIIVLVFRFMNETEIYGCG